MSWSNPSPLPPKTCLGSRINCWKLFRSWIVDEKWFGSRSEKLFRFMFRVVFIFFQRILQKILTRSKSIKMMIIIDKFMQFWLFEIYDSSKSENAPKICEPTHEKLIQIADRALLRKKWFRSRVELQIWSRSVNELCLIWVCPTLYSPNWIILTFFQSS